MSVDVALSVEGQRAQHSAAPGAALPVGSDGEVGHGGDGGCELSELSELQQLEQECQEPEMSHGKNGKNGKNGKIEIVRCIVRIVCVLLRPIRARDRQKYSIGLNRTCQVGVLRALDVLGKEMKCFPKGQRRG